MRWIVLFFCLVSTVSALGQIIPNSSFEEWTVNGDFMHPDSWETNQDSINERVQISTDAVEGNYALKIIPATEVSGFGQCASVVSTALTLDEGLAENMGLTFYTKSMIDTTHNSDWVFQWLRLNTFRNGAFVDAYEWRPNTANDDYTKVKIPIENADIDSIYISILGGATISATDACVGHSILWIDDMRIEELSPNAIDLSESSNDRILLYPNPASDHFYIQTKQFERYAIYDISAKLIAQGEIDEDKIEIPNASSGMLFIQLSSKELQLPIWRKLYRYKH